ncbi:hypothetical protein G5B10_14820 [Fluviicola sp. SGL-29]|nr:hypothetical protein [Fluviicola sp. SGL-29]
MEVFYFLFVIAGSALFFVTSYKKYISNKKFLASVGAVEFIGFRTMKKIAQSRNYTQASQGGMLEVINVISYFFIGVLFIMIFVAQMFQNDQSLRDSIQVIVYTILFLIYLRWGNITSFRKTIDDSIKMSSEIVKWKGIPFLLFIYFGLLILPSFFIDNPSFEYLFSEESIEQINANAVSWFMWFLPFIVIAAIILINNLIYYSLWGVSRTISASTYYLTRSIVRLGFILNKRKPWLPIIFVYSLIYGIITSLLII